MTRLLAVALVALVAAPAAFADGGPSPGLSLGWPGVAAGGVHYVVHVGARGTDVAALRQRRGHALRRRHLAGAWGVPLVTYEGDAGGLSHDGRLLVLAGWPTGKRTLQQRTSFLLLATGTLRVIGRISLHSDFSFDALSPDTRTLYLIEHDSVASLAEYRVRAFDLSAGRLLPQVIADRTSWETAMEGYPLSRATSRDGGEVYTLYLRGDGRKPFVHALDARHLAAVCLDVDWPESQNALWQTKLALDEAHGMLVFRNRGAPDEAVLRMRLPARAPARRTSSAVPKLVGGAAGGLVAAVLALGLLRWRRSRRPLAAAPG